MNELKVLQHTDGETSTKCEALELHFRLKADIEIAGNAIVDFAESLKTMRDKKLFTELGYKSFGEYTKREHNIEERQAYNYITSYEKLGKEFLQSNANLGITKIQLLAAADWGDREQVIENNNIEDMSVTELKAALDEVASLKQQLSFLQDNPITVEKEAEFLDIQAVESEIRREQRDIIEAKYRNEIDNLQAKADKAMTDDELQKYKDNAIKEAKSAAAEEIKKLKTELKEKEKAAAESEKLAELSRQSATAAAKESERLAQENSEGAALKAKYAEMEEKATRLEKQIKLSAEPEWTRFKFLLEAWENATRALNDQLLRIDEGKQAKVKDRIKFVIGVLGL